MKLKINNKVGELKITNLTHLLNEQWLKEEIAREIRKSFEINENEDTT